MSSTETLPLAGGQGPGPKVREGGAEFWELPVR